jgi:uncharacterized Zn finger protein
MKVPQALNLECPSCGKVTLHNLKRGRVSAKSKITFDSVVECGECKHIHHTLIVEEKHIDIPVIISQQDSSSKLSVSLPPKARLNVGDEIMVDDTNVKITGIELPNKRVKTAEASEVMTLWCKRFDKLKLKISIHSGSRTLSRAVIAVPDEEFYIGDIIRSARDHIVIHKIKTHGGVIKDGGTTAREIVRLYGRFVR